MTGDRERALEAGCDDYDTKPVDFPGLEDEIRREAEEIAELEREMGLRGTTEARPRRGDDPVHTYSQGMVQRAAVAR